jgi:hypothetical protein
MSDVRRWAARENRWAGWEEYRLATGGRKHLSLPPGETRGAWTGPSHDRKVVDREMPLSAVAAAHAAALAVQIRTLRLRHAC